MIKFHTLGRTSLVGHEGSEIHSILARPKLLGLLSYLATATPRGFHRRDTLIGLFWPDTDQDRARRSLRQSLFHLRQSLGPETITVRGDDEVTLNDDDFWCDVWAFDTALERDEREEAVEMYMGDFLQGFYLPDLWDFESWVDRRRSDLRGRAAQAATEVAEERPTDATFTAVWAQHALRLAPLEEGLVRRVIRALDGAGDRAGAARVYEEFAKRLAEELEVEPSIETQTLLKELRRKSEPAAISDTGLQSPGPGAEPQSPAAQPPEPPSPSALDRSDLPVSTPGNPALEHSGPTGMPAPVTRRTFPRIRPRLGIAIIAVSILAAILPWALRTEADAPPSLNPRRILVGGFENRTSDPTLDPLARMTEDWIRRGLEETGLVEVTTVGRRAIDEGGGNPSPGAASFQAQVLSAAVNASAGIAVSGALYASGDTLLIDVNLVDVGDRQGMISIDPVRASRDTPLQAIESLRQRVMGALATIVDPRMQAYGDIRRNPPTYDGYLAFMDAETVYHQSFNPGSPADHGEAKDRYLYAYQIDTTLKVALVQAALAAWENREYGTADSLASVATRHGQTLPPEAANRLGWLRSTLQGDHETALRVARNVNSFPLYAALSAGWANHPGEVVELLTSARGYADWLGSAGYYGLEHSYWNLLSGAHHRLGDHESELAAARQGRDRYPDDLEILDNEVRALAAMGRVDQVNELIDVGLAIPLYRGPVHSIGRIIFLAAMELQAHGHQEAAVEIAERMEAWFFALPAVERESEVGRATLGSTYFLWDRVDEATAIYRALSSEFPDNAYWRGLLGVLAAKRGDQEEAMGVREDLARLATDPYAFGWEAMFHARISAQLGEHETAIAFLRRALAEGYPFDIALHRNPDFESLRADPRFQELMRPKG